MSFNPLIEKIIEMKNPTVAGLDPKLDYVPQYIRTRCFEKYGRTLEGAAEALYEFNTGLIDALCDIVPAVKPQMAYYEMYGWQGVRTFARTVEYAKSKGMYVITDGKRNDIGATMEAYAAGHLGITDIDGEQIAAFGADALTVNGYLGTDGIDPLLKVCAALDKGIFVLVKTSNKSSGELQNLPLEGGESIYGRMACMCDEWGRELPGKYGFTGVGAVVGATYPEQLTELRKAHPSIFFLVPGYGAQGGGAKGLAGAFNKEGLGAVVNSSRAIMCAYKKEGCDEADFAGAARREALRMKDDINGAIR
ncbi:MAG: orotidine-5'-phosphate decarboxylase [Clostridia bacterium]|nr:orotidine-5'-phosphate decarboxylase [Clostridia bacterium]